MPLWFQHTATRRWLRGRAVCLQRRGAVSTHSHPKVAASTNGRDLTLSWVSTHSHPKVAAPLLRGLFVGGVSFNTQPPEGGCRPRQSGCRLGGCFNTQPPEGGCRAGRSRYQINHEFQHTATRRWLHLSELQFQAWADVSTHSHPKVAAAGGGGVRRRAAVSTHSHPKVAA